MLVLKRRAVMFGTPALIGATLLAPGASRQGWAAKGLEKLREAANPAPAAPTVAQAHMAIDATPADMAWAAHGPRSTGAAPAAAPLPVLQGLHQPAHGGPTAMIDGRLLQVGERIGERTVIGIDHQGVTLRGPDGTARLRLPGLAGQRPPADRATSAAAVLR